MATAAQIKAFGGCVKKVFSEFVRSRAYLKDQERKDRAARRIVDETLTKQGDMIA